LSRKIASAFLTSNLWIFRLDSLNQLRGCNCSALPYQLHQPFRYLRAVFCFSFVCAWNSITCGETFSGSGSTAMRNPNSLMRCPSWMQLQTKAGTPERDSSQFSNREDLKDT